MMMTRLKDFANQGYFSPQVQNLNWCDSSTQSGLSKVKKPLNLTQALYFLYCTFNCCQK